MGPLGSNDGMCGLTSRDRRDRRELAHYSVPCEVTKRRELSANQRGPSPDTRSANTLIPDITASETMRNTCSLFKPPSVWHICYNSPNWLRQELRLGRQEGRWEKQNKTSRKHVFPGKILISLWKLYSVELKWLTPLGLLKESFFFQDIIRATQVSLGHAKGQLSTMRSAQQPLEKTWKWALADL